MKIEKPNRPCPVCQSRKVDFIHAVPFVLFDNHPMTNGYNVVQCQKCFFVYADVSITQNELDFYYKDLSKYEDKKIATGGGYNKNDRDRLAKTAGFISSRFADKNIRIIDIGCANGGLLKELKKSGFENLVGLDPSASCVEVTRKEVGCDSFQMSLYNIDASLGKFDLVILSHVMEHLLDLTSAIETINQLLTTSGCVYAECPNASNYDAVIHAPFQEFNSEHINHFTEISFENLFGLHSFEKITTGDKTMTIASGQDYHAVYGVFRKAGRELNYQIRPDTEVKQKLHSYIKRSSRMLDSILQSLDQISADEPVALFGIGQFAFKLLYMVKGRLNNMKLFDNSSLNVNKKIDGIPILPGKAITDEYLKEPFVIVIASLIYEKNIRKEIEEQFRAHSLNSPCIISFGDYLTIQHAS